MIDTYWPTPQASFDQRREAYLEFAAPSVGGGHLGFFSQIARLELGREALVLDPFMQAIDHVAARRDCSDFTIAGLLRILYKYRRSPLLDRRLATAIEKAVLGFKYWWDEPTEDGMCYWTENHQILFHSDELLAGQLFPDRVFRNSGRDGRARVAHALPRIIRWMDWRATFGFSEWLSNCYFDEDLLALTNLYDFAHDPEIRRRAGELISLLLFELALHSHRGVHGSTNGRTYAEMILGGRNAGTASTLKLMLGMGVFSNPASMSAISLATSNYRCPPIIEAIAADAPRSMLCQERHSIEIADAARYGIAYDDIEQGVFFWGLESFVHPLVRGLSIQMLDRFRVHQYPEFREALARYQEQVASAGDIPSADVDPTALTEVNIETYRTPDYQLSCAQDYRPGCRGYQQHIWQATLGMDAVVFTNHPGSDDEMARPNYWAGNGRQPRAAQFRNVLACLYRAEPNDQFQLSHAYFPRAAFDEVLAQGGWTFGRAGDGYVALYSAYPTRWGTNPSHRDCELVAAIPNNAWLCELGNRNEWRSFDSFVRAIATASVTTNDGGIAYISPTVGHFELDWSSPLRVDTRDVSGRDYPRFSNPYARASFGERGVTIERAGERYELMQP